MVLELVERRGCGPMLYKVYIESYEVPNTSVTRNRQKLPKPPKKTLPKKPGSIRVEEFVAGAERAYIKI